MILFWLLCVCLLLVGLTVCPQVRAARSALGCRWVAVRQSAPRSSRRPVSVLSRSPPHYRLSPPRLFTRAEARPIAERGSESAIG